MTVESAAYGLGAAAVNIGRIFSGEPMLLPDQMYHPPLFNNEVQDADIGAVDLDTIYPELAPHQQNGDACTPPQTIHVLDSFGGNSPEGAKQFARDIHDCELADLSANAAVRNANERSGDSNAPVNGSQGSSCETGGTTHDITRGDNLFRLAKRYGVSVYELQLWNNLLGNEDPTLIIAGEKLIVSCPPADSTTTQVDGAAAKATSTPVNNNNDGDKSSGDGETSQQSEDGGIIDKIKEYPAVAVAAALAAGGAFLLFLRKRGVRIPRLRRW